MSTTTKNYNLTKLDGEDFFDIGVINDNMDAIDTQIKKTNDNLSGKYETATMTLTSSGWSSGVYNLAVKYPSATYDVTVELDGSNATEDQYKAWTAAKPVGTSANTIKLMGKTPAVDIPVVLKVVKK